MAFVDPGLMVTVIVAKKCVENPAALRRKTLEPVTSLN
jgi:hypothetical protein